MRGSSLFRALCFAGACVAPAWGDDLPSATGETPKRVVSMNLCTDQLAMMVAAPEQLYSVSSWAVDPRASVMAEEAKAYEVNHGLAEEIYLMKPDLVLAGSFSARATVEMLKRLGIRVAVFEPAYGLDEVRDGLNQMGVALGQEAKAQALVADYDQRLANLRRRTVEQPTAALYYANGYTSGNQTLAGQILMAAGFRNAAAEAGYASIGFMPLEILAMQDLDALIMGRRYPGASRSEEILDHPVVQTLHAGRGHNAITDRDWVCGTPRVLQAIERLGELHDQVTGG